MSAPTQVNTGRTNGVVRISGTVVDRIRVVRDASPQCVRLRRTIEDGKLDREVQVVVSVPAVGERQRSGSVRSSTRSNKNGSLVSGTLLKVRKQKDFV